MRINPVNYIIHIEPDLANFTFRGDVELVLETDSPVRDIMLNALELSFVNCQVRRGGAFEHCDFRVDSQKEQLRIVLPEEMAGSIALQIDYHGAINDKMAGFYRSRYLHEGKERHIAVTQFEESSARMAFPCFDHPLYKATFDIEMVIDENLVAISNGPIMQEEILGNGKKRVKFQQTPLMSTYLLFFGVGRFDFIEDVKKVTVRAASMPGTIQYARFGLNFARQALEFCESYYDIPYPLPKLDLIAIPDFAFGAMENWGAITFRENLLLHYPHITSKSAQERICEVIAHELVHQWFGNLVSPSDWKYLWLNESFATYFGYGVVDHFYPQWKIWDRFLYGQTTLALERDAHHATFPIEIPGGEHVVINASTAPIIYSKGGSILRQIKGYIGDDNFQAGLRHYLKKYEYSCASSPHLWEAFEEMSEIPVTAMMKSWIEQPGYPVIEAQREGEKLSLIQKRFTYLPNESSQQWLIPVKIKIYDKSGAARRIMVLLEDRKTQIDLGGNTATFKINEGQTGFYRVRYKDETDLEELGRRVLDKTLPAEDRWGLQNDLFAMVRSSEASIERYLEFLAYYEHENRSLPLISIAANLFQIYRVIAGAQRDKVATLGCALHEKSLAGIGYEPGADEPHTTSVLRDQIIWDASVYGSKKAMAFALDQFDVLTHGGTVHPDIMQSVMQVGAMAGKSDTFDWLEKRFRSSESEHDRMNILTAFGCFGDRALIEKALRYVLDKVPSRNKYVPIVAAASNPLAAPCLWDWYVAHLDQFEQFHPLHYERVLGAIIPICGLDKASEVKAFFAEEIELNKKAADIIRLSLEKLEINLRMRAS